jgi:hypothetical protein
VAGRRERHSRHGPPILIGDDEVSSGGTGNIPGAVDFFHSAIFSNDSSVVNWVDESFAPTTGSDDCLPTTDLAARAWHPAGTHKTGRMFFSDLATGAFLSEFQVVDLRPEPGAYCSAHMGMPIMGGHKDLLVNAWYMGGADVIDFTNPRAPKEVAFYDMAPFGPRGSDTRGPRSRPGLGCPSAPRTGSTTPTLPGVRGVPGQGRKAERPTVDHLNPQTMDM